MSNQPTPNLQAAAPDLYRALESLYQLLDKNSGRPDTSKLIKEMEKAHRALEHARGPIQVEGEAMFTTEPHAAQTFYRVPDVTESADYLYTLLDTHEGKALTMTEEEAADLGAQLAKRFLKPAPPLLGLSLSDAFKGLDAVCPQGSHTISTDATKYGPWHVEGLRGTYRVKFRVTTTERRNILGYTEANTLVGALTEHAAKLSKATTPLEMADDLLASAAPWVSQG